MNKRSIRKIAYGCMAIMIVASMALGTSESIIHAASDVQARALTSAPPPETTVSSSAQSIGTFGVFDPKHVYLDTGNSSISASAGVITVSGSTSANQIVDSIGVTFSLQRWDGSSWITVSSSLTTGGNQTSFYNNSMSTSVTAGYYYRGRTIHWIIENGVYEQGERVTNSVLAQ